MLKVSRSSVSTNIRLLLLYGFVEKAQGIGERTDSFTIAANAWHNAIRARVEGFKALKAIARQGREALPGGDPAVNKIAEMEKWADSMIEGHEAILVKWMATDK
jgi:DNA-binding transcriptional regulator GbsR (MarR family)